MTRRPERGLAQRTCIKLGENKSFKIVMLHMYINIYIYVQIMPTKVGYEFGGLGGGGRGEFNSV
jgi:hypothetical protein